MSYSCLPNLEKIIAGHNRKILTEKQSSNNAEQSSCNCRPGNECPLKGNCLKSSIVYKAEVKLDQNSDQKESQNTTQQGVQHKKQLKSMEVGNKVYLGTAANTFKERFRNHKLSFTNARYKNSTTLSTYIWKLKDDKVPFQVHWSTVGSASSYLPSIKNCHLCNLEKTLILLNKEDGSLNQRSELMSKCRHKAKHLLCNY